MTPGRIYGALFYTMLLSVYTVFFSVQCFFNFDGHSEARTIFKHEAYLSHYGKQAHIVVDGSSHSTPAHKIRLNKRFHQENFPPCEIVSVEAPPAFVTHVSLGSYRDVFLSFFTPVPHPLRGPPVVA